MSEQATLPVLNHELAADELSWVQAVYADFAQRRAAAGAAGNPRDILRQVLADERHQLATPMDVSGRGPWRGRNSHDRLVAAVFLPQAELHRHPRSRTDQFAMYVNGEADAFSLAEDGTPRLKTVVGGDHFHNPPDAPHAFLPKVGRDTPADWEIAFIAITPRNLREDTYEVSDAVHAAYERVTRNAADRAAAE